MIWQGKPIFFAFIKTDKPVKLAASKKDKEQAKKGQPARAVSKRKGAGKEQKGILYPPPFEKEFVDIRN